ncbi:MAG TPA: hypothetical protein VMW95_03555 [Desulfobacterales bacterium]|nr:hypothetical protein [Desulfobacterales bacterium]
MTLEDYKLRTDLTYEKIGQLSEVGTDATFRAIKFPWRTRLSTVLKIARVIGAPADEAEEIWKASKREYQLKRFS